MKGLKEKNRCEFKEGIKKINKEFQEFFALMFGGELVRCPSLIKKRKLYQAKKLRS